MAAGIYNMTFEQGATKVVSIVYKDPEGVPINLTGCTARMQIRPSISSDDVYVDLTTENGKITINGSAGLITLFFSAEDTSALVTKGVYDLELVFPDEKVHRVIQGTVTVSKEVTRG